MSTRAASRKKKIKPSNGKKSSEKDDTSESYNKFKKFEGKEYLGWLWEEVISGITTRGVWKEKKITPDLWEISYSVAKRRAGKAPEGSGVPVGTEYHWYIISHQNVKKINANDYTTVMSVLKYKLAHKRASKR